MQAHCNEMAEAGIKRPLYLDIIGQTVENFGNVLIVDGILPIIFRQNGYEVEPVFG
jgi:hypothetical protein